MVGNTKRQDWIYEEVQANCWIDTSEWILARVSRVLNTLQSVRRTSPKTVVVFRSELNTAFTAPGQFIYISTRLFERCATDEMLAMVIAHEMAHHDLGHLDLTWPRMPRVSFLVDVVRRSVHSQRNELAADALAMSMCMEAGYDAQLCLGIFRILEHISLDYGNIDAVLAGTNSSRGSHPPLRERAIALRRHVSDRKQSQWTPSSFRSARYREFCLHCEAESLGTCSRCTSPICMAHQNLRDACPSCDIPAELLCLECNQTDSCFDCGFSQLCCCCPAPYDRCCVSCSRGFCISHMSNPANTCSNCRLSTLLKRESNKDVTRSMLAILAVCAFVIAILYASQTLS